MSDDDKPTEATEPEPWNPFRELRKQQRADLERTFGPPREPGTVLTWGGEPIRQSAGAGTPAPSSWGLGVSRPSEPYVPLNKRMDHWIREQRLIAKYGLSKS